VFGIDRADSGEMSIDGKRTTLNSPRAAIAQHFGFLPEDRKTQGIIPDLTIRENIILALQASKGFFRAFSKRKQYDIANHYMKALSIAARDADQPIKKPLRRQPAEGDHRPLAREQPAAADPRRADARHRRRRQGDIQKLVLRCAMRARRSCSSARSWRKSSAAAIASS
jgi:hypothetical protein